MSIRAEAFIKTIGIIIVNNRHIEFNGNKDINIRNKENECVVYN